MRITMLGSELGRVARPHAGTAQKEQDVSRHCTLRELFDEFRVGRATRVQAPLDSQVLTVRERHAPNPVAFGLGAHIDEFDHAVGLQKCVRFLRRDGTSVRQGVFLAALAGGGEKWVVVAHEIG